MSNVIAADAWPSIFWTALTFAPADTARLAAVWRKSCGVVRGTLEDLVRQTLQDFDTAIQKGDLAQLRAITCGKTRDVFGNSP
jgi:hypothetical protein